MDETTGTDRHSVTMTGLGRAFAPADAVYVRLGVEVTAATPTEAFAACADVERRMVATVTGAGVAATGVTTSWTAVSPRWEEERHDRFAEARAKPPRRPNRYTAHVHVEVVAALASAGAVAAAALDAAGTGAVLHTLAPVVRDRAAAEAAARRSAYADARTRAEQYAALVGQRLGRLLVLTDAAHEAERQQWSGATFVVAEGRPAEPEIHGGQHVISTAVRATWELAD